MSGYLSVSWPRGIPVAEFAKQISMNNSATPDSAKHQIISPCMDAEHGGDFFFLCEMVPTLFLAPSADPYLNTCPFAF